jgi:5-methyltetrahydropteroyltriglutamate--homocysteine methyltransferase
MRRSEGRFLTTHAGSLIRPPELLDLAGKKMRGEAFDEAAYEKTLQAAVAAVVSKQREVGVDIVNDGEFGKSSWSNYILERLSGFEISQERRAPLVWLGRDRDRFREFFEGEMAGAMLRGMPAEVCTGPIRYQDRESVARDLRNLAAATAGMDKRDVFFTTVAPASTAFNGVNEFYPSEKEYVYAIAEALREEYQAVHAAGFLVQVDDAVLANMYDHLVQDEPQNYRRWAQLRVDALNHALAGIPEDRVRYHICFGSWHVPHVADAPLEAILDLVLQVKAGAYSIEAANARHEHEWQVWESTKLPVGKVLIPGVVSHHTITVEHPELVAQRIERFAKLVGPENVIGGTDCGFAQAAVIQRVHPTIMWAKLASLAEGAQIASKRFWK